MPTTDILWLTRGVSFGHATRDVSILGALRDLRPNLNVRVVSYAQGYSCLQAHGIDVKDLGVSYDWLHRMNENELVNWFLRLG